MEVKAEYRKQQWPTEAKVKYICVISNQDFAAHCEISNITGSHLKNHTNDNVTAVWFVDCKMRKLPRNLTSFFENIHLLLINNCGLRKIEREDLTQFTKLTQFYSISNAIAHVPGDLFRHNLDLQAISFENNKIFSIGSGLLDVLSEIRSVDFTKNAAINAAYAEDPFKHSTCSDYLKIYTLDHMKALLRGFQPQSSLFLKIQEFLKDERHKDFNIIVDDQTFPVHKFILAARSPVLAEMIRTNPNAENLNLTDIPLNTFRIILDFMYRDELPVDGNMIDVLAAAGRLDIKELKIYAAKVLLDDVDAVNAYKILLLSNRYDMHELKMKAFGEIKALFPDKKIKDELASEPEKLWKLMMAKKKMEDEVKRAREEFESLDI